MKYRLISKSADGVPLALRIANEGNEVDMFIKDRDAKASYKGILPQVPTPTHRLDKQTIILFDMVKMGDLAEKMKKSGYKVYGVSGKMSDALELNREMFMRLSRIHGLKVPEYEVFGNIDKGIEFIKDSDKIWVFKPFHNQSTTYTYVPENNTELAEMMKYFKGKVKGKYLLQEKIEGRELSTEAYYVNGKRVPNSINSTIEQKGYTAGNKSVSIGCAGSLVWFWKKKEPKSFRHTLKPLEEFLGRFNYNAPMDINAIISEDDGMPYVIEATCRPGYNPLWCQLETLGMEAGKFFYELASGNLPQLKPSYDYSGAVRLSIPPYPFSEDAESDVPIIGVPDVGLDHLHLMDVKFDDNLYSAGVDGVIAEVTDKDKDINKLADKIYKRIDKLTIPNVQYREDIFELGLDRIKFLKEHNYFK